MASYPGAVKAFSVKNAGDTIQPADVNDLQDEVNAIEAGILNGTAPVNSSNSTVAALSVTGGSTHVGVATFKKAIQPSSIVTLTDGATVALDASLGNVFRLAASGNRTISDPTNPAPGQKVIIQHVAVTSARTLALSTNFRFGTDVAGLTATSSAKTDYIGLIYNDSDLKWDVVGYVKGY